MRSHAGFRDAQGRTFSQYVTERVSSAIFRSSRSINQIADESGINHMTLRRSLEGQRVFNVDDIARLAKTLGTTPAALMNAEGYEPV